MIVAADAMHHWVLRCAFAGLASWLLFAAWAQHELRAGAPSAAGEGGGRDILVLYDERGQTAELEAALAGNLAGRFGRARFMSFARYRRGDLGAYDAAIVIPGEAAVPESLTADVRRTRQPAIWIGSGIPADTVSVRYKGRDFPRDLRAAGGRGSAARMDVPRPAVLAAAVSRDGAEVPWAVRSGNLFHIAESPFAYAHEDDRYIVFADLLYEALAPEMPERHRAMVRIDGVGPDTNPRRLRTLADLLAQEGVPFSIAVYDSYRDPGGRFSNGRPIALSLHQRPRIVAALRHAVSRGATLVAQGHTHQSDLRPNPHARVSGADLEYFAADLDGGAFALRGPLPGNAVARWRGRFEASGRAWRRSGLGAPSLFATPLNAASVEAYLAVREHYLARYERSLYFAGEVARGQPDYARGWSSQFFPFETVDLRGDFIVPENLGALSATRGPGRLLAAAERNLAVRDGFASFSFPWYESPEALRTTVQGLKRLGYRFVSPEEVVRSAPAHAAQSLHRASPLATAASGWVRALPPLGRTVMVALLALVAAMWLAGEVVLRRLPERSLRAQRASA